MRSWRDSPALVGLAASLILFAIFCFIVAQIATVGLTVADYRLMNPVHDLQQATPNLLQFVDLLSDFLGTWAVIGVTGLGCLELFRRRHYRLAAVWLVTLVGAIGLNESCKHVFHRLRPPSAGIEAGWSFPSGHSIRAMVAYSYMAYLTFLWQQRPWLRRTAVMIAALLILVVGFTRVYLGKHYPSDVMGAYALGGSIVAAVIGCVDARARRSVRPNQPLTSAPPADPV
jgi:undecaprenyl-diphosphatase